ncbi:MAG: hypothetical protein AAGF59_04960 [Pseudomonadota bacterium]
MFGVLFGRRNKKPANDRPKAALFPGRANSESVGLTEDYLNRQEAFLQSIGPHMRHGVDTAIALGRVDYDFAKRWNEMILDITPAERGQLLVDWAHWHTLRAHKAAADVVIHQRNPLALPLLGNTFRLPESLCDGRVLKQPLEFSHEQAKQFLDHVALAVMQKGSHLHIRTPRQIVAALERAISDPDEALASRIRNADHRMSWASPLLTKLCPISAGNAPGEEPAGADNPQVADALKVLQMTLRRLPGMWVTLPAGDDPFWGTLNHQLFPVFREVDRYLNAVEKAAYTGTATQDDRARAIALFDVATDNLAALKTGHGLVRTLIDVSRDFPDGEHMRTGNPFWHVGLAENEKDVFDAAGRPKIDLMAKIESIYLAKLEERLQRLAAIAPKTGLAAKLVELLPGENASAPTKTWLQTAAETLDRNDLLQIVEDIQRNDVKDPRDVLYDPTLDPVVYEGALIKAREFQAKIWAVHLIGSAAAEPLYDLARANYEKVSGVGPKNAKLGNAAAVSLSLIEGGAGVPQLLQLQRDVKYPKIKKFLEKCLSAAAERVGTSKQDMEEQAVTDHGFA